VNGTQTLNIIFFRDFWWICTLLPTARTNVPSPARYIFLIHPHRSVMGRLFLFVSSIYLDDSLSSPVVATLHSFSPSPFSLSYSSSTSSPHWSPASPKRDQSSSPALATPARPPCTRYATTRHRQPLSFLARSARTTSPLITPHRCRLINPAPIYSPVIHCP